MPKLPHGPIGFEDTTEIPENRIECMRDISQDQLSAAKIYTNREEYIKTLPKKIKYMEIGVAWGYYSNLVCKIAEPRQTDLVDVYTQDLKCWSWRKFGECQCLGTRHELLYTPETHQQYIVDIFSKFENVKTIKGYAPDCLPDDEDYDYIYIDTANDRFKIREMLKKTSKMVRVGGTIGLNDYVLYDGVIEDAAYGTPHSVNEFLHLNKNWSVDAIALHPLGFYDIYIRRNH